MSEPSKRRQNHPAKGKSNNRGRQNQRGNSQNRDSGPKLPVERKASSPKVYVAIDTADFQRARGTVEQLRDVGAGFKLGLEFFSSHGVPGVARLLGNQPLFLDLKFHDIPNTVAGAMRSIAPLRPTVVNVHTGGGIEMMKAAKAALIEAGATESKLIGVTVLTSLNSGDLKAQGIEANAIAQSTTLAKSAKEAGLDGVVCSAAAAESIGEACGDDFMRVTPGMRLSLNATHDQKQTMAPADAARKGATHLVVGRLVTQSPDPKAALRSILGSLD